MARGHPEKNLRHYNWVLSLSSIQFHYLIISLAEFGRIWLSFAIIYHYQPLPISYSPLYTIIISWLNSIIREMTTNKPPFTPLFDDHSSPFRPFIYYSLSWTMIVNHNLTIAYLHHPLLAFINLYKRQRITINHDQAASLASLASQPAALPLWTPLNSLTTINHP